MRKTTALVTLALVALVGFAGLAGACGANGGDGEEAVLTSGQVLQRFREETGKPLLRKAPPGATWEQLGLGLDPQPDLVERYGTFVVYVVEPGRPQAVGSLLRDKATGKPLARDERGIYWERDTLSGTWVANKRYGANVVLAWFSDRSQRATDARFQRLDRILAGLERGALG